MNDEQIALIKDSREPEAAWDMYFSAPTVTACLITGDYSVSGYEDQVAIERKTIDDLVGCLGKHRDRFERELERAKGFEFFAVLVETSYFELREGFTGAAYTRIAAWSRSQLLRFATRFRFCFAAIRSWRQRRRRAC